MATPGDLSCGCSSSSCGEAIIADMSIARRDHPEIVRSLGAQQTSSESLASGINAMRQFNIESDKVLYVMSEAFAAHAAAVSDVKKGLSALEARAARLRERAHRIAEAYNVTVDPSSSADATAD